MAAAKVKNFGLKIWEHKKKTMFAGAVLYWAGNWVRKNQRNASIRTYYAKEALQFGNQLVSAESRPRRITVLGNSSANERHVWDDFTTNALPLFHLAGLEVHVIKTETSEQLEKLALVLDGEEADAIYVVGGDGTIQRALTAIFREKDFAPLPIGFSPGGYDNLALRALLPTVFKEEGDVRRWCESAMCVIEDTRREVKVTQTTVTTTRTKEIEEKEGEDGVVIPATSSIETTSTTEYGISPIYGGWFGHIEERRRKLWYWFGLKRRFAYFWEMVKRSPSPTSLSLSYEEFCPGCNQCRSPVVIEKPQWRWYHLLIGMPMNKNIKVERDYSKIVNENCGKKGETKIDAVEFNVNTGQMEDSCRLWLESSSGLGRFGVMREGWSRCSNGDVAHSTNEIYDTKLAARAITLHVDAIPTFLSRVYVAGDSVEVKEGDSIDIRATRKTLQAFLPLSTRLNLNQL
ncbi:hypothetical protein PFISCL1PPCAC_6155 [Pristionchus fissidentatus]|uniref:DAGKc domain-containing protein n=1 Tax=Pristionchus fissidentatus TaxID=1538716 RepID=A0AAV5V9C9_9BILA|nr:hypothetical protein PFISCL1PPCAC_6155 [Pristionchus fissidentatus]